MNGSIIYIVISEECLCDFNVLIFINLTYSSGGFFSLRNSDDTTNSYQVASRNLTTCWYQIRIFWSFKHVIASFDILRWHWVRWKNFDTIWTSQKFMENNFQKKVLWPDFRIETTKMRNPSLPLRLLGISYNGPRE